MVRGVAVISLLALALAGTAEARTRPVAGSAPQGLKAFTLRSDEGVDRSFARTPSFAWKPVRGAVKYEFQLSTSSAFRESGLIYTNSEVTSPAASVPMSLPWITGNPYSLYARVRAVLPKTITPWSPSFGFNMRWETLPKPIQTFPGLLRWTPVEGAYAYDVWFLDVGKIVRVTTNVIDQREYYTFHQTAPWMSSVHWRIRAVRPTFYREGTAEKIPAAPFGPWTPIYESVNPPFAVGSMGLGSTVSDVISNGGGEAHRLMPAYTFSGNLSIYGGTSELYRVVVFTDRDCINEVFRGAIVGSPAYAPRPFSGPLSLPGNLAAVDSARRTYATAGIEGVTMAYDYRRVQTTELLEPAKPFTKLEPMDKKTAPPASGSGSGTVADDNTGELIVPKEALGAPVDLWDTDWPRGGYYWTVIPVAAEQPSPFSTSVAAFAATGTAQLSLASGNGLNPGDTLAVGNPANLDTGTVLTVSGSLITISPALRFGHAVGEPVVRTSGQLQYRDMELAQEACAAGRVKRFGKSSEPSLTSAHAAFASGLSPTGRLVAASVRRPTFYGHPHVAWTPALGAWAYHVQWSKTRYPFRAEPHPTMSTPGMLTFSTSATLPLAPGTWYYRVRGINFELGGNAQHMSWSDPAGVRVVRPKFRVVSR
jgi:hypothetical protein